MILLDTSFVIEALSGTPSAALPLRRAIEDGERIRLSALVLFEWLRGPRRPQELAAQEALFPASTAIAFGPAEAAIAAALYRTVTRPRGREIDLAIAACAIAHEAILWTLNVKDFRDIPELRVAAPPPVTSAVRTRR